MNLLPKTEREDLKKGLKLRSFVLALLVVSASFISGAVMLMPAYFLASGNIYKDIPDYSLEGENSVPTQQFLDLPKEIDFKLKLIQNNNNNVLVTDSISKIIDRLPEKVKLNSVSFKKDQKYENKNGVVILISGVSAEREPLVSYLTLLKESGVFSMVDMPVSNLTKDKDLPFSIKIFIEHS